MRPAAARIVTRVFMRCFLSGSGYACNIFQMWRRQGHGGADAPVLGPPLGTTPGPRSLHPSLRAAGACPLVSALLGFRRQRCSPAAPPHEPCYTIVRDAALYHTPSVRGRRGGRDRLCLLPVRRGLLAGP